ncbi:MAG: hypothetical protein HOC91_06510 [Nitrospinaceae bacterium]|jgi:hypothetical protein|nr:hypothetical protein [Nitrospinaceae bacterium]MBT3820956.1 hypothetical protein [Nitrospinaceae bacterium]MBT4095967.1 hypothetical protein [Nitrospinaceae bacterium]MBT4430147.1 hypothetical protein [Nitrospinaceae bacterium]MBT5368559.1 hypothetical protein [Nitrospinaceae bacterium]
MVDAVSSSSSAPPPAERAAKTEVEGGSVELDVTPEAGGGERPEAAPESDVGANVDDSA